MRVPWNEGDGNDTMNISNILGPSGNVKDSSN